MSEFMPSQEEGKLEITDYADSSDFKAFAADGAGIMIVPESYGQTPQKVLFPEAGRFAKWMKAKRSDIQVNIDHSYPGLDLKDQDIWMPLIYLSQDVSLQLFLKIVAAYLYDRLKGSLKTDRNMVHLKVCYEDTEHGSSKLFEFNGNTEALEEAMRRFHVNKFLG